ncbi:MAG: twin-arginine translocation signal domain-containing protein [Anaerolineales bacterium]
MPFSRREFLKTSILLPAAALLAACARALNLETATTAPPAGSGAATVPPKPCRPR